MTDPTSQTDDRGPLSGVRVLDFGQYIAGPLAALLLSEQGADVVHVDPPGGPRWAAPANAFLLRGRRSIEIDLKQPAGLEQARQLVASADVVIENFRPGVMAKLGLGPDELLAEHAHLVYCSLPGFAADDPRAQVAAYEGVVAAAMGTYAGPEDREPVRPAFTALPIASTFAGMFGAIHAIAALIARDRDGRGQHIEIALHDAMFEIAARHLTRMPHPLPAIADQFGFGLYPCKDGRWISWQSSTPRFLRWVVEAAGVSEWITEGVADNDLLRFSPMRIAILRDRLGALFATRAAFEWEELLGGNGVPLAAVRTMDEWIGSEVVRKSELMVLVRDVELGETWQPNRAVSTRETQDLPLSGRRESENVDTAVSDWAQVPKRPEVGAEDLRPALDGIRVLDLAHVVAGPTMGRILAEFGANVVKVNHPADPGLDHYNLNRGKRSITLDITDPEQRFVFDELLARTDVLLHSFSPGTMTRMGYGAERLLQEQPRLIFSSLTAYSDRGPWAGRRGYEHQGQAASGIMARYAGMAQPEKQTYVINDHGAGLLGAFGTLVALYGRSRTGRGNQVKTSLAQISLLHQCIFAVDYPDRVVEAPGNLQATGYGPDQRLYRCVDGMIFAGGAALHPDVVHGLTVAECVERFNSRTCGVHGLTNLEQIRTSPINHERGRLAIRELPGRGTAMSVVAPVAKCSRIQQLTGWFPNPPGSDKADVLAELAHLRESACR